MDTSSLMEQVLSKDNLNAAYLQVVRNKGAAGVDGMAVEELGAYLSENGENIKEQLRTRKYKPQPVRRVEIPKPDGGTRNLGVPTVTDRFVQQAVAQVLTPIFEEQFHDHSYGFRPNRCAQQAVLKTLEMMNGGHSWIVDIDLAKFFDTVDHDKLMTKVLIETGRYAVGKAGFYVTHVLDKKTSYGKTFVILANTLNGFLRPSIARLVARYAGNDVPAGSEPLFTSLDAFEIASFRPEWEGTETVTLVGDLCTASDMIAEDIILPVLKQGDPLIISNAGSYGAVLSPMQFSSQRSPAELFLDETGRIYESGKLLEI